MKNQYESLAENTDLLMAFSAPEGTNNLVRSALIAGSVALLGIAAKSIFAQVPTSHFGMRTRNGRIVNRENRPYGFESSGLHKRVPLISGIKSIDMGQRTTTLGNKTFTVLDRGTLPGADTFALTAKPEEKEPTTQQIANFSVIWRILHGADEQGIPYAYRQFMVLADEEKALERMVGTIVSSSIVSTSARVNVDQFRNEGFMYRQVREVSAQQLTNYGVGLVALRFEEVSESPAQKIATSIQEQARSQFP